MRYRMNYFRTKSDEYRRMAAGMTGGIIRLQLRNMAEYYDRMAELYEDEHHRQPEKVVALG